ncbi:MAG: cytochrome C [Candidatus Glassbacteria bacterium]|nr:cytochrome C [Candidatus Glassbacteria bacterium]
MNYPVWELLTMGGGSLIALIAIPHVYISHLAVGGGLFLWLTDIKGFRENSPEIHGYLKKHIWFFLLLTMVFGGITGVGIWFIISLVSPAATAILIHNFVFGWAIEWVFFLGEIVALLIYHYQYDKMSRKARLRISFLYFLFAWLSMVVIVGIIDFMLTPGDWLETREFWDGFFNPTYWPSLFFRSFIAFTFAGLFGYVTTLFLEDRAFRQRMVSYCTKWLLYPLLGLIPSAAWYFYAVPPEVREVAFEMNKLTGMWVNYLVAATVLIFLLGIVMSNSKSLSIQRLAVVVLVPVGLMWMGGFEYIREISRKPYVLFGYMYSNSILKADAARINEEGVLKLAKWSAIDHVTDDNLVEAGREVFNLECMACHTVGGLQNDIVPKVEPYGFQGLVAQISGQGKILGYMPPFLGTSEEKLALVSFIWNGILGRELPARESPYTGGSRQGPGPPPEKTEIPPFDPDSSEYVLLVWNDQGMHSVSDCDEFFSFLPPGNTLQAQLIRRDPLPERITSGVTISYKAPAQHANPARHTRFWDFADKLYGAKLEQNAGLKGNAAAGGTFKFDEEWERYEAKSIPLLPYRDDGKFDSYPVIDIEARDSANGELLASTKVVAPVSTEADCWRCHGGEPRKLGAGISDETATNILKVHDYHEGTQLYQQAIDGNPQRCQSCHADPALGAEGTEGVLNFSAAMHGWHANYMGELKDEACYYCHPVARGGVTRYFRGVHGLAFEKGKLVCGNCHGDMNEMAVSLLNAEKDKPRAAELARHIQIGSMPKDSVHGRTPWLDLPDCFACHVDFGQPGPGARAFNNYNPTTRELYRNYKDNGLINCIACHGSPHAVYPVLNPHDTYRDVLQPMQYQGEPYAIGANVKNCTVCHIQEMENPIHHENIQRMVRNKGGFEKLGY